MDYVFTLERVGVCLYELDDEHKQSHDIFHFQKDLLIRKRLKELAFLGFADIEGGILLRVESALQFDILEVLPNEAVYADYILKSNRDLGKVCVSEYKIYCFWDQDLCSFQHAEYAWLLCHSQSFYLRHIDQAGLDSSRDSSRYSWTHCIAF